MKIGAGPDKGNSHSPDAGPAGGELRARTPRRCEDAGERATATAPPPPRTSQRGGAARPTPAAPELAPRPAASALERGRGAPTPRRGAPGAGKGATASTGATLHPVSVVGAGRAGDRPGMRLPAATPAAAAPSGPPEPRSAPRAAGRAAGAPEGASGPARGRAGHPAAGQPAGTLAYTAGVGALAYRAGEAAPGTPDGAAGPLVLIPQQQFSGNCPPAPPERGPDEAPERERRPRNPELLAALAEDPQLGRANYHKRHGVKLARHLNAAGLGKAAARVEWCSRTLCLDIRGRIMHREACRFRVCPMCQSLRASRWSQDLRAGLLAMLASEGAPLTFAHLTLTVRNCAVGELRERTRAVHHGLDRMTRRAVFPALGYVRNTEVTVNLKERTAHPHVHMLLVLPGSYFTQGWHYEPSTRKGGRRRIVPGYMTHAEYVTLWQECARLDYAPSVRVQAVKLDTPRGRQALYEVAKYGVKPASVAGMRPETLGTFLTQLRGTRAIGVGGMLSRYVREPDEDDETPEVREAEAMALWDERARRYVAAPLTEDAE